MNLSCITASRMIILTALILMIGCELILDTGCIAIGRGYLSLYITDASISIIQLIVEGVQFFLFIKFAKDLQIKNSINILKQIVCLFIPTFILSGLHTVYSIVMYGITYGDAANCYYFQLQNYWRLILLLFTLLILIFVLLDMAFLMCFIYMTQKYSRRTPSLLKPYHNYIESVGENQMVIDDLFKPQNTQIELLIE